MANSGIHSNGLSLARKAFFATHGHRPQVRRAVRDAGGRTAAPDDIYVR